MARAPIDLKAAAQAIDAFLGAVGAPVESDPALTGTGQRVAEAYAHDLLRGYSLDPRQILADRSAAKSGDWVVVRDIAITTMCPHHLMPARGVAHIGYIPAEHIVGLGALAHLVDCYSRRLTLQEPLGQHLADALVDVLGAKGAGCVLDLSPTCLTSRGDRRHEARAVTAAWSGLLRNDASARAEFLSLAQATHVDAP